MFQGAGASVLTETNFKGLLGFPYIGFSTTSSFTLEPINKVEFLVSRQFIFYMHMSITKLINGVESSRYTVQFVDVFLLFPKNPRNMG